MSLHGSLHYAEPPDRRHSGAESPALLPDPLIARSPLIEPTGRAPFSDLPSCQTCPAAAECLQAVIRLSHFARPECNAAVTPHGARRNAPWPTSKAARVWQALSELGEASADELATYCGIAPTTARTHLHAFYYAGEARIVRETRKKGKTRRVYACIHQLPLTSETEAATRPQNARCGTDATCEIDSQGSL